MKDVSLKQKYNRILRKLHTCSPAEKSALKQLLDYYYHLLAAGGS